MSEPDELYTLRAQYWLGHYQLALDEAKSIARKPMPSHLKVEREEFVLRSLLAMKQFDKVQTEADSSLDKGPGVQALSLRAKYDSPATPASAKSAILGELQALVSSPSCTPIAQLVAAQVFLSHGDMTKEALSCVYLGTSMEHMALTVQIYLFMDRLDLAKSTLKKMKQVDEEAILTQLCSVYVNVVTGKSEADDAVHTMASLSEQYGSSVMLLNLTAVACMAAEKYAEAETALMEASAEGEDVDTLINLVVCYQQQGKDMATIGNILNRIRTNYPDHAFVQGLKRVEGAFEREAAKYKVSA
jgi:tetratricopeptide (TPR) repeat protein